jgi:hypothetical protein
MKKNFKIGIFDQEGTFITSIESLREEGLEIFEVFTPYPMHEVFKLLKRRSRMPTVAYFMGLAAVISTLGFLYYTAVINWPLVYGGKPFNSFPSFIVITLVLTILTVTIGSLFVFSVRSKLFPGRDNTIFDIRATDDKFIIVISADDLDKSQAEKAGNIMKDTGAVEIVDKEYENVAT